MNILDLFAGVGGFSLAGHWLNWKTVAFVERDIFCQSVLRKNFGQDIEIYDDITTFSALPFRGRVDIVTGGFPCQDISAAGKQAGINAGRSGLWFDMLRIISEIRPPYIVVENVSALLIRGMDTVLGGLSEIGYDAEWRTFSACEMGFPHARERVFIVAYPERESGQQRFVLDRYCSTVSQRNHSAKEWCKDWLRPEVASGPDSFFRAWQNEFNQSPVIRMDDGLSDILASNKAAGNAIVPQIAYEIFRAIEATEKDGLT